MLKIFKNREFLRLWGNQVLLQTAFNMSNFTALLIIADRTHSPFTQAQFYTVLTLPAVIFGLVAGPVVDMAERKTLMLITDFLLAILFFAYVFADGRIFFMLLIAFLTSSVARFFIPAEAATIPLTVDKEILNHANSFFLFTLMGSVILGYSMAGPIIQIFGGLRTAGELAPFIISSIFLIIGFFLRLGLRKIETPLLDIPKGSIFKKTFHLFWETVKEVRSNKAISLPLGLLVFVELMVGILSVVFLEYVRRYLQFPLTSVSYILMGPLIMGLILGMAILGRVEKIYGFRKSVFASLILTGTVFFIMGIMPLVFSKISIGLIMVRLVALTAAFLMGILMVLIAVQSRTVLQTSARTHMHGRIFSFLDIMIALATPVPVLLLGFLADKVSLLATLMLIGASVIALTYFSHKFILRS